MWFESIATGIIFGVHRKAREEKIFYNLPLTWHPVNTGDDVFLVSGWNILPFETCVYVIILENRNV